MTLAVRLCGLDRFVDLVRSRLFAGAQLRHSIRALVNHYTRSPVLRSMRSSDAQYRAYVRPPQHCLSVAAGDAAQVQLSRELELLGGRVVSVPVVWARCGVMGERMRLECPLCARRVCTLYCLEPRLAGRRCNGLWYAAQRSSGYGRRAQAKKRIRRERAGGCDTLENSPSGFIGT